MAKNLLSLGIVLLASALVASSCGPKMMWVNPDASKEQGQRDFAECRSYAQRGAGPAVPPSAPSISPGRNVAAPIDFGPEDSARIERMNLLFEDCMTAKGYKKIPRPQTGPSGKSPEK
jgi:hypothetical protein